MRSSLRELLFNEDKLYPPRLGSLAAWYDSLDPVTMLAGNGTTITDGGAVALWGDKSGNSGVNCLVLPGVSGNYASFTALTASRTGDFSVSCKAKPTSLAALAALFGGGVGSFGLRITATDGKLAVYNNNVGLVSTSASSAVAAYQEVVIGYVRSSGSGQFYLNGATFGSSFADGTDYTPGVSEIGSAIAGSVAPFAGSIKWARYYNAALDATAMAADAAGTVQANNVLSIDFSTAGKKLANGDTFTCATGQTVTLNSYGATGARIAGERDLYQGTLAKRPVYLAYAGVKYGYMPAATGNYFSGASAAAMNVTGDFELNVTWTAGAGTAIARYNGANVQFLARVLSNFMRLLIVDEDGASAEAISTASHAPLASGTWYLRWTRTKADGVVKFWYSADGVTYTQLGADVVVQAGKALIARTTPITLGAYDTGSSGTTAGRWLYADMKDGIGGTKVAEFNPALYTSGTTFTASTGEVWTINGGAHIVTRTGLYFNGTTHNVRTALFALSQPETVYGTLAHLTWADTDAFFDGSGTSNRMALIQTGSTPRLLIAAGGTFGGITSLPLQTAGALAASFNGASSTLKLNRASANAAALAGTHNANGFTLGGNAAGTTFGNIFVSEVAIYGSAHGTATQDRWALYEGRKHGFSV